MGQVTDRRDADLEAEPVPFHVMRATATVSSRGQGRLLHGGHPQTAALAAWLPRDGAALTLLAGGQHTRASPEPSVIYSPAGTISQKKLENPASFWNNVGENRSSLFQNKGAFE